MLVLWQVSKACRHWLIGILPFVGLVVCFNCSVVMMKEKQEQILSAIALIKVSVFLNEIFNHCSCRKTFTVSLKYQL